MKIIVCGGRHFYDYELLKRKIQTVINMHHLKYEDIEIVSGHCEGADMLGEKYAQEFGASITIFPAQWEKYGRAAGPIRNKQMVDYIKEDENPLVIAFTSPRTKGTRNTIKEAKKLNIPVIETEYGEK